MAFSMKDQEKFFKDYNIKKEEFDKTGLEWDVLKDIYIDYKGHMPLLESTGETIANILRRHPDAHTVRMRVKDPEHLVEKLIRKKVENNDFSFDLKDYKTKITDLIGVRVLHLYKEDAIEIDKLIRKHWNPYETPTIYYREGDSNTAKDTETEDFVYKKHPAGYRSWHYLIESKLTRENVIAEIQVRTIFEEGWSEIDHRLRYPYNLGDQILKNQLMVLNRLAGSADEMVESIREALDRFNKMNSQYDKMNAEKKNMEEKIKDLKNQLEQSELKRNEKDSLLEKVDNINKSQEYLFSTKGISSDLGGAINIRPDKLISDYSSIRRAEIKGISIDRSNFEWDNLKTEEKK
ncbi:hypothetical protein RFN66_18615 [Bacillus paralicheniformis]|uniref:RelA/SpoT domain-containing protein n=1 Tax=Bacillus TaxID=1386 RepID=UPI0020B3A517|nr:MULTISPECIES: hypothetical protein [Bacillus]WMW46615.1 hypothetical protein RFN66_18615 [Bacillus paralicheniformis]